MATILTFWAWVVLASHRSCAYNSWVLPLRIEELHQEAEIRFKSTSIWTIDARLTADLIPTQYLLQASFDSEDPDSSSRILFHVKIILSILSIKILYEVLVGHQVLGETRMG